MTTTQFVPAHQAIPAATGHVSHGTTIPVRHTARKFVPAPVSYTPVAVWQPEEPVVAPTTAADAVLELLRSVNRNRAY